MSFRAVGIDLGITSLHKAVIVDSEGRQVGKVISFDSSLQGYDKLLEASLPGKDAQMKDAQMKDAQMKVKFIMEPTSTSWIGLSAYLISQGHEVYLITPQKSADLRRFYHRHSKSDRIDAKVIAKLPIVDPEGLNPLQVSGPDTYSLYRLSLEREQLVRENEGDKKRIKAIFNMAVPQLSQAMGSWQFSLSANAFLKEYANPFEVARLGLDRLREFLEVHSHGSLNPDLPQKIFDACQSACQLYGKIQAAGQMPFDYEQIQRQVRRKVEAIQYRQEQIKQTEKEMADYYSKVDPQKALQSVKGFGLVIASALIGALGNVGRFRNAKAIVAYCGFAPRKKQSGNTDQQGMPLTKAGKRIVKKYLYLAGEVGRQYDPQLASIYFRLRKAGKPHTKAMGAVAAHMATRAYAVLKRVYQTPQPKEVKEKSAQAIQYELRDLNGKSITPQKAREIIQQKYQLPKNQGEKQAEPANQGEKQAEPAKQGIPESDKIQGNSPREEDKAAHPDNAQPDNVCQLARQSKTPQSGSSEPAKQEIPESDKIQGNSPKEEGKAAHPDNVCQLARQSKTPQSGSLGSLEQLAILENIIKQKNCQEQVKKFLLQNQNVFESTATVLSWLDKGIDEQDLRETILANIALYRKKIWAVREKPAELSSIKKTLSRLLSSELNFQRVIPVDNL
jgi:transposase